MKNENKKLKELIKASKKFNSLPVEEQKKYMKKIIALPQEKKDALCDFFSVENAKETEKQQEQLELLNKMYEKVVRMKEDFEKLLKKDVEKKECEKEKGKMNTLLNQLENH